MQLGYGGGRAQHKQPIAVLPCMMYADRRPKYKNQNCDSPFLCSFTFWGLGSVL